MIKDKLKDIKPVLLWAPAFFAILLFAVSCSSTQETIRWNVELEDQGIPVSDRCDPDKKLTSIKSPDKPQLIPETEDREARIRVEGLPCAENEDPPVYELPMSRVKRITYVSDPLLPPENIDKNTLSVLSGCCRTRDGLWFFDKFEVKAMIGYRGEGDGVTYPTATGEEFYDHEFFSFDRGGSTLITGLELGMLWNLDFIDESHKFQFGLHTGLWPQDGSFFVPAGLMARYTFNQSPGRFSQNCNTWFIYANAGLPFDFETDAPVFNSPSELQRYYYGLGIGYDIAINCDMDLSMDLGIRQQNLPLPEITCCPTTPDDLRNPFRNSTALLLRIGLAF